MATPSACNEANPGQIAKAVLMPGDPLRAKYVAEHYLENPVCFNSVRNMLGYTGDYKGKQISVMGHGMGVPSIGLYTYELYQFYGVESIIRIGSAGGIGEDVRVRDVVIAMGASTNSHFAVPLPGPCSGTPLPPRNAWVCGPTWDRCSPPTSSITTILTRARCTVNSASWRWKWRRPVCTGPRSVLESRL